MRKLLSPFTLVVTLLLCFCSHAQDFSNKGKDFWVAYGYHQVMNGANGQDMRLYFAAEQTANVTVTIPGIGFTQTYVVPANSVISSVPMPKVFPQDARLTAESVTPENKGIHITSDKPIVAYAHIYNASVSGATILYPTPTLGKEYYSINYTNISNTGNANCWFYVVAADTGTTTVEITPSAATLSRPAGVPFTVTLTQGQVYNLMGQTTGNTGVDLTGSVIKSINTGSGCKRLAVFSGSGRIAISCNGSAPSSDNYMVQAMPKAAWGKKYLTTPTVAYSIVNGNTASGSVPSFFRVCVSDPTTIVRINGLITTLPLINNFYYQIDATPTPQLIEADKPITVAQYMPSQGGSGCGTVGGDGDPEVIYLSPVEQSINKVVWNACAQFNINTQKHYINVLIKNAGTAISSFTLDGVTVPPNRFAVHPQDPAYSYAILNVTSVTGGNGGGTGLPHIVQSDSGFNAIAYGYGPAESYGYNAGTNIKDLYQFVTVQNQYGTVDFPAACKSSPFFFSMTFPYQPLQIQWKFNGLFPDVTLNSPVFDSTWVVNGKQLYRYKLPAPYTINTAGTYPISVVAQNPTPDGCGGTQEIEYDLQVFNNPVADFTFTTNGCLNNPVQFNDNSNTGGRPVVSRYWDFADGNTANTNNPSHTYAAAGTYDVRYTLITDIGCVADTAVHTVDLSALPAANFTIATPTCVTKPVTFNDQSTVGAGATLVQWEWNFGDGSPVVVAATNASQVHTYNTIGTYTVTLKVTSSTGCESAVFPFTVTITDNPVADFSFPNICLPAGAAQFTNLSTISDGTGALMTYNWDFGDGSPPSTAQNPLHNYAGVGPYNAILIATSNKGCTGTITKTVNTIYAQPQAGFTSSNEVCVGSTIGFTDQSTAPGATIVQWFWDFGDGSPLSTLQNPVHSFTTAGTFTVRHWILTDKGCYSDTLPKNIIVNSLPSAQFNATGPFCVTRNISFTDVSVPNSGIITNWQWDLGDGTILNLTNNTPFTHQYAATGTYTATLQVTTDKGCISTVFTRQIDITPLPLPGFIIPEVCLTDAFAQFTDTSSITAGTITGWLWNFGDGSPNSTLQNPQHSYAATGVYTVTLTVTSNNGCASVISKPFTVNGDIPVANFNALNPATMCANDSVAIQDASTVNFGSITKVEIYWDNAGAPGVFETDDFPTPGKIYKHKYPNFQAPLTRTFNVRYRAYSGGTCVNDRIKPILVNAAPLVQFNNIPNVCLDAAPFQITQATETGGVPGTGVFSGPGITAGGIFNPASVGPGTYTIKYTYTSAAGGCVDSASKTIRVLEPPVSDFGFIAPACETKAITFNSTATTPVGTLTTWTWDFGDGSPQVVRTTAAAFTHTFANWGVYPVRLNVTTSDGCNSGQKLINIAVNPQPKPNFTIPASVCLPNANVTFNNLSGIADGTQSAFSYLWNFDDPGSGAANTSILANAAHTFTTTGPFNVNLTVTSGAGCKHDTTIVLNTIHPQPIASFNVDKTDVCIGGSFTFTDNSNPLDGTITQWNWTLADGNVRNTSGFTHTYANPGSYNVSLFIFNSQGCRSNTFTTTVSANAYPPVNAGPDKFVLEGGQVTLTPALNANMPVTYQWTPPAYLSNPAIAFAIASPPDDIIYTLTVTSDKGCSASDKVFVKVLKAPKIPNIFSPNGDGIHDTWIISYLETYPGCTVDIYNRYGQIVYHSVGYTKPWDGTINGNPVAVGTYYYIVDPKNGRKPMSGYVDVIR